MTPWLFGEILLGSFSMGSPRLTAPASGAGSETETGSLPRRGCVFPRQLQAGQCNEQVLRRALTSSPDVIPLGFWKNKGQGYLGDDGRELQFWVKGICAGPTDPAEAQSQTGPILSFLPR